MNEMTQQKICLSFVITLFVATEVLYGTGDFVLLQALTKLQRCHDKQYNNMSSMNHHDRQLQRLLITSLSFELIYTIIPEFAQTKQIKNKGPTKSILQFEVMHWPNKVKC